jgi:hypothetical protein
LSSHKGLLGLMVVEAQALCPAPYKVPISAC